MKTMSVALACLAIMAFFVIAKVIDTKVAMSQGGGRVYLLASLTWIGLVGPLLPAIFWAERTVYLASGERLWTIAVVMFASASFASAGVFWFLKGELPSGGTLAGLILSAAAVACCLFWR